MAKRGQVLRMRSFSLPHTEQLNVNGSLCAITYSVFVGDGRCEVREEGDRLGV